MDQLPEIAEPNWATAADGYGAQAAEIASRKWHELAAVLRDRGSVLWEVATALELYAVNYARMVLAERDIAKRGAVIEAPKTKVPQHNPNLTIANKCAVTLMKLDKQLNLLPDSGGGPKKAKAVTGMRL